MLLFSPYECEQCIVKFMTTMQIYFSYA